MTKRLCSALVTAFMSLGLPTVLWAHPGHGETPTGAAHYLLEPVHASSLAIVISLGIAAVFLVAATKMQHRSTGDQ